VSLARKDSTGTNSPAPDKGERIAKVIARSGLCSRRDAERMIAEGRVTLDGKTLTSAAVNVTPKSKIEVDGAALQAPQRPRLWRFHKPKGYVTTTRDPEGRKTIYDLLPPNLPRVQPVGRLDINSEGLLLLTNDGGLKRQLELPSSGWRRKYRVRVRGRPRPERLAELAKGVTVDGVTYGAVEAVLERQSGANAWLEMTLTEGKNREVRRICQHLGLTVNRLIRVSYGPFHLGHLKPNLVSEVPVTALASHLDLGKDWGKGFAKARPKKRRPGQSRRDGPKAKPGNDERPAHKKRPRSKAAQARGAGSKGEQARAAGPKGEKTGYKKSTSTKPGGKPRPAGKPRASNKSQTGGKHKMGAKPKSGGARKTFGKPHANRRRPS